MRNKAAIIICLYSVVSIDALCAEQGNLNWSPWTILTISEHNRKVAEARTKFISKQENAIIHAAKEGWGAVMEYGNGNPSVLVMLDENGQPIYLRSDNANAAATVSTNLIQPYLDIGVSIDGDGETIGLWEYGDVYTPHEEFKWSDGASGSRVTQVTATNNWNGHATHVAGTLIALGVNASYPGVDYTENPKGMAPESEIRAHAWGNNFDVVWTTQREEAVSGMLVSNHSYGEVTGWSDLGGGSTPRWIWYGDIETVNGNGYYEDYRFGHYGDGAREMDSISYDYPFYLVVKSAGNDGTDVGGVMSDGQWAQAWGGGFVARSGTPPPSDCSTENGSECMDPISTAKNILTVGSVGDLINGYIGSGSVLKSSFSVTGPTDDGRIKPDVMGKGEGVYSSYIDGYNGYATMDGTSQSAPNVTGSLTLLQQHYKSMNSGSPIRAATLKALVIHAADESGQYPGPDYKFGWGLLDTKEAADIITNNNNGSEIIENTIQDGGAFLHEVTTDGQDKLVVTVAWTDPPGEVVETTPPTLDSSTAKLVNDLDVRVYSDQQTFYPWVLNPTSPSAGATKGDNSRDNIEQIVVDSPGTQHYTIKITHKGQLVDGDPNDGTSQAFSVIVSGVSPPIQCSTTAITIQSGVINSGIEEYCSEVSITTYGTVVSDGGSLVLSAPLIRLGEGTIINSGASLHATTVY